MEEDTPWKWKLNKAGIAILLPDKETLSSKQWQGKKESIHEEHIRIINI